MPNVGTKENFKSIDHRLSRGILLFGWVKCSKCHWDRRRERDSWKSGNIKEGIRLSSDSEVKENWKFKYKIRNDGNRTAEFRRNKERT